MHVYKLKPENPACWQQPCRKHSISAVLRFQEHTTTTHLGQKRMKQGQKSLAHDVIDTCATYQPCLCHKLPDTNWQLSPLCFHADTLWVLPLCDLKTSCLSLIFCVLPCGTDVSVSGFLLLFLCVLHVYSCVHYIYACVCVHACAGSMTRQEGQWSTASNFAGGEKVGASWTDKVMALKATAPAAADNTGDDVIGDDEWVRKTA